MKRTLSILILFSLFHSAGRAQCPTITLPPSLTLTSCSGGQTIAAISNYSANIVSKWTTQSGIPLVSSGTSTSVVHLNYATRYWVEFKDTVSNCVTQDTFRVHSTVGLPIFSLNSLQNFATGCSASGAVVNIVNAAATNTAQVPNGGAVSYSIIPMGGTTQSGTLSANSSYSLSNCGVYTALVRDNVSFCTSSFDFSVTCLPGPIPTLAVTPNTTVCMGSSATLTASGMNSYAWNNGIAGATNIVMPTVTTTHSVMGYSVNGCTLYAGVLVMVSNTCQMVWPGDANSDGVVDNTDVFEISFGLNSTGAPRTPGGNLYVAQYAAIWTGTISSGKNLCHADCNGDGTINLQDTVAIFNNYSLTHTFKPGAGSADPEITLTSVASNIGENSWNKVDIILGSIANPANQIYGVAFDLNYDAALIESGTAYIKYTGSFINANNNNVEFRKTDHTNGSVHAATIRTDATNVSGSGKIGEFYFKMKPATAGSTLNLSVSNSKRVNTGKVLESVTGSNVSMSVQSSVGFSENNPLPTSVVVFPNPVANLLSIQTREKGLLYQLTDVAGRLVINGVVDHSANVDVSSLKAGAYFLKIYNNSYELHKKIVVNH